MPCEFTVRVQSSRGQAIGAGQTYTDLMNQRLLWKLEKRESINKLVHSANIPENIFTVQVETRRIYPCTL